MYEFEFENSESSALATTIAFQYLSRIKADDNNDMVKNAILYLLHNVKRTDSYFWEIVPKAVETAPRASWWNYKESRPFSGNPNAEILGYFYEYKGLIPHDILDELTRYILNYLDNLQEPEFHELLCFLRLLERMPKSLSNQMSEKLNVMVEKCVTVQPELWQQYCLQPIQVAQTPHSPYYKMFEHVLPANLDYIVSKQTEEGCWNPTWAWGQFEDTWQVAKVEWQGLLTLDYLRST